MSELLRPLGVTILVVCNNCRIARAGYDSPTSGEMQQGEGGGEKQYPTKPGLFFVVSLGKLHMKTGSAYFIPRNKH